MRAALLAVGLAASSAASSQTSVTPAIPSKDVVVTGRRLGDTEAALKACIARHCAPNEDIDASLAHAENQFVAGDYTAARATVRDSLRRNKRFARTFPVPVADLWRAESRIAIHQGDAGGFRTATISSLDVLKAGLPVDDPRVMQQQLDLADALAHLGGDERGDGIDDARVMYNAVQRRAQALGRPRTAAYVQLKKAMLYTAVSADDPVYRSRARQEIARLARGNDPELAPFRQAAQVLAAELALKGRAPGAGDRLVAAARMDATEEPMLLYAPPIDTGANDRAFQDGDVAFKQPTDDYTDQWADVSFWVRPDGTVGDADVIRGSQSLNRNWLKPVLLSIAGRRYAPLRLDRGDPGILRVERYTFTAHLVTATGSRIRTREAYPRIEMVDLSINPVSNPPAPPAG